METDTLKTEPRIMGVPTSRSVKIDTELWKKIKLIVLASEGELNIQEFINDALRPVVEKEHAKALKKINAGPKGGTLQ